MKTTDAVQVPLLGRGRHAHPLDGGCLMELVAATVGGPWTDHPLCTPPVLAQVARTVNDHTSAEARPVLAPLIPYLIADRAGIDNLEADLNVCQAVLASAATFAPADLIHTLTRQVHQVADEATAGRRWLSRRRQHHKLLAITHLALRALYEHASNPAKRDRALYVVLVDTINTQRAIEDLHPITTTVDPQSPLITGSFTVLTRLIKPSGADWLELEVSTDTSQLPDWLSAPWRERQSELDLGPYKPSWTCLPVS